VGVSKVNIETISVLHVDDDEGDQKIIREALSDFPIALTSVNSLEKAFDRLRKSTFDMVILDLNMPPYTDLEALRAYKQFDAITPVVVVSGIDESAIHERVTQMGASECVDKAGIFQRPEALFRILRRTFNTVVRPVEQRLDDSISALNATQF
jgi:CheY-like chemotaxis protein